MATFFRDNKCEYNFLFFFSFRYFIISCKFDSSDDSADLTKKRLSSSSDCKALIFYHLFPSMVTWVIYRHSHHNTNFYQSLQSPIDQSLRRPLKIHEMFHCLETHNVDQSLRRSLKIQELFHEQEFHPQLQQIETEKFGQNLWRPLRIQEIYERPKE